jgi:hypothetical protein
MSFAPRVTKPEQVETIQEPTGPVAADSLAAESLQDKGGFSENPNAAPLGVRGDQSTLSNTDTSGATVLAAATDSAEREKKNEQGQGADERGVAGLKYPEGAGEVDLGGHHSHQGFVGGSGSGVDQGSSTGGPAGASDFGASTISSSAGGPDASQIRSGDAALKSAAASSDVGVDSGSSGTGAGPATGTGVRPHVDAAPNYVSSVTGAALPEGTFKPKGTNLDDASQTDSIPQTKTFTGAVGTVNDPGRLAERDFEGRNNDPVAHLGGTEEGKSKQQGDSGETGQFGVLQSERA